MNPYSTLENEVYTINGVELNFDRIEAGKARLASERDEHRLACNRIVLEAVARSHLEDPPQPEPEPEPQPKKRRKYSRRFVRTEEVIAKTTMLRLVHDILHNELGKRHLKVSGEALEALHHFYTHKSCEVMKDAIICRNMRRADPALETVLQPEDMLLAAVMNSATEDEKELFRARALQHCVKPFSGVDDSSNEKLDNGDGGAEDDVVYLE